MGLAFIIAYSIFIENPTMRKIGIIVLLALLLQSCGKKGPLYLPPAQPPTQPSPETK